MFAKNVLSGNFLVIVRMFGFVSAICVQFFDDVGTVIEVVVFMLLSISSASVFFIYKE